MELDNNGGLDPTKETSEKQVEAEKIPPLISQFEHGPHLEKVGCPRFTTTSIRKYFGEEVTVEDIEEEFRGKGLVDDEGIINNKPFRERYFQEIGYDVKPI